MGWRGLKGLNGSAFWEEGQVTAGPCSRRQFHCDVLSDHCDLAVSHTWSWIWDWNTPSMAWFGFCCCIPLFCRRGLADVWRSNGEVLISWYTAAPCAPCRPNNGVIVQGEGHGQLVTCLPAAEGISGPLPPCHRSCSPITKWPHERFSLQVVHFYSQWALFQIWFFQMIAHF